MNDNSPPRSGDNLIRRLRNRRRAWWGLALLVLAGLSFADHRGWLLVAQADDLTAYHGVRANVTRVIDGDTIEIDIPDSLNRKSATRVRLWGIDCPERATKDRVAEPWAEEARTFVRDLLEGRLITLSLEPHRLRGTFGRVLAHVEIFEVGNLNVMILEAGLAEADERWSHRHLARYAKAQRDAQRNEVGLWEPENNSD